LALVGQDACHPVPALVSEVVVIVPAPGGTLAKVLASARDMLAYTWFTANVAGVPLAGVAVNVGTGLTFPPFVGDGALTGATQ